MGNSATRGNPLSTLVLLLFLIYGLSMSGCSGGGGGAGEYSPGTSVTSDKDTNRDSNDIPKEMLWPDEIRYPDVIPPNEKPPAEKTDSRNTTRQTTGEIPDVTLATCFGSPYYDVANSICESSGSYVFAGKKTYGHAASGYFAFWIVKIAAGRSGFTRKWETILDGSNDEEAFSVNPTSDNGYIVAGYTKSNDGDVEDTHNGAEDAWIVKLDSRGNKEWDKCVGGSGSEYAYSVQQTTDGGYIVAGENNGSFWVFKLDNTGTPGNPPDIEWSETFGGYVARSVQQTKDGGYVAAGYTSNSGYMDCLVVKLAPSGAEEWSKEYGGKYADRAYSVCQTTDGGYIVGGYTGPWGDGQTNYHGDDDYWVFKLDSIGTMEWERCIGGSDSDRVLSLRQTQDGGYIVAGQTMATGGDWNGAGFHGMYDCGVVKLDNTGAVNNPPAVEWAKCAGGESLERCHSVIESNGAYIIAGSTYSGAGREMDGDVSGNNGENDAWIAQVGEPVPFPTLTELTFENTLNIANDDGSRIPPTYYQVKGQSVIQNPAAMPLSRLTPVTPEGQTEPTEAEGLCNITIELSESPQNPVSFEVQIKSPDDNVLADKAYATFSGAGSEPIKGVKFTVPYEIQIIEGVKVEYRIVEKVSDQWVAKSDWREDSKAKPEEKFYITLEDPVEPNFSESGQDKARTDMLDVACQLAMDYEPEETLSRSITISDTIGMNPELLRFMLVKKVYNYCLDNNFKYDKTVSYSSAIVDRRTKKIIKMSFRYDEFIRFIGTDGFKGDCQAVSGYYTSYCLLLGVPMNLKKIVIGTESDPYAQGCYMETFPWIQIIGSPPEVCKFSNHQWGSFSGYVYDPLLRVSGSVYPNSGGKDFYFNGFIGQWAQEKYNSFLIDKLMGIGAKQYLSDEFPIEIDRSY